MKANLKLKHKRKALSVIKMTLLKGNNIQLRALEPEDLDWLFAIENNVDNWEVSSTLHPFSKDLLKKYLANAHQDLFTAKQLRMVICIQEKAVGLIDLFDYDPQHHRAGIGILILSEYRSKGVAYKAIQLLANYAFTHLQIHQLYANIIADNTKSLKLFKKIGFKIIGTKKEWIFQEGQYKDELFLQLLNHDY